MGSHTAEEADEEAPDRRQGVQHTSPPECGILPVASDFLPRRSASRERLGGIGGRRKVDRLGVRRRKLCCLGRA